MDERTGGAVLERCFSAAGFHIERGFKLVGAGFEVVLDGYDPARRVGYEYLTTEAGDRAELTPPVVAALEAAIERGDFHLLLVDELDVEGEAELELAARRFIERLPRP